MTETFKIESRDKPACVTFRSYDADFFMVEVSDTGLNAQIRVGSHMSFGLDEFFAGLAESWKGWNGEREWTSFERELKLAASNDGRGHIYLAIDLAEGAPPTWEVKAGVVLEAGQLDQVASAAKAFVQRAIRAS